MASISLENVSLTYPVFEAQARSLKNTVLRAVGGRIANSAGTVNVQALRNVSFELRDGDRLALVGRNGAGKSTLLKVLSRIYEPQEGRVEIIGKSSPLTDITLGMDFDATGYENIIMRCVFLGMTRRDAEAKLNEIGDFSELGSYLALPMRTYSTGMVVRLAFAASTASRAEILIMDELIGAGDAEFAEKARQRIMDYISNARIMVLASHNNSILSQLCNKGLYLDSGQIQMFGPIEEVLNCYNNASRSVQE